MQEWWNGGTAECRNGGKTPEIKRQNRETVEQRRGGKVPKSWKMGSRNVGKSPEMASSPSSAVPPFHPSAFQGCPNWAGSKNYNYERERDFVFLHDGIGMRDSQDGISILKVPIRSIVFSRLILYIYPHWTSAKKNSIWIRCNFLKKFWKRLNLPPFWSPS